MNLFGYLHYCSFSQVTSKSILTLTGSWMPLFVIELAINTVLSGVSEFNKSFFYCNLFLFSTRHSEPIVVTERPSSVRRPLKDVFSETLILFSVTILLQSTCPSYFAQVFTGSYLSTITVKGILLLLLLLFGFVVVVVWVCCCCCCCCCCWNSHVFL